MKVDNTCENLLSMNSICYYWFVLTVVIRFLWETSYIGNYEWVGNYSKELQKRKMNRCGQTLMKFGMFSNNFAMLFYATYAAWADREYMSSTDD